jgi:hypothetical protein
MLPKAQRKTVMKQRKEQLDKYHIEKVFLKIWVAVLLY